VSSTGYKESFFGRWYAGPLNVPVECLNREWEQANQTEHLVRVYERLLAEEDRVVVLGYYRGCNWSFGNWQPNANVVKGPSAGKDCKKELRPIGPEDPREVSQWQQAVAVGDALNAQLEKAVEKARAAAKKRWPNTGRANNLVFTKPDPALWEAHQPITGSPSWLFLNDTWIHPSQAGAANLAETVAAKMCSSFGHWCGTPIRW
jgi:hypothetical protein